MNVEWREIPCGSYEVSNDAKIRRYMIDDAGKKVYYKPLTPQRSNLGDLSVNIIDHNHKVKKLQLARLVAEAFDLPNPNGYKYIGYIDGDKGNCTLPNLQWVQKKDLRVTTRKAMPVQCIETGEIFRSKYALAQKLGVSITRVRQCMSEGRSLKGYTFVMYENKEMEDK